MRDTIIVVISVICGMLMDRADHWWTAIVIGVCLGIFITLLDDVLELNRDDS